MALTLLLVNSVVLTTCLQQQRQSLLQRRNQADLNAVLKLATVQLASGQSVATDWQYHSKWYQCARENDWIRIQEKKTGDVIEIHWTSD